MQVPILLIQKVGQIVEIFRQSEHLEHLARPSLNFLGIEDYGEHIEDGDLSLFDSEALSFEDEVIIFVELYF